MRRRSGGFTRVSVRIASLLVAAVLVLWCSALAVRSFTPQSGAGLPRLAGGPALQALLGLAALAGAALVIAAAFALTRPPGPSRPPVGLIVGLGASTAAACIVASRAPRLFLAPVDPESDIGPGMSAVVAPLWGTYFWTLALACALLAVVLTSRSIRDAGRSPDDGVAGRPPS